MNPVILTFQQNGRRCKGIHNASVRLIKQYLRTAPGFTVIRASSDHGINISAFRRRCLPLVCRRDHRTPRSRQKSRHIIIRRIIVIRIIQWRILRLLCRIRKFHMFGCSRRVQYSRRIRIQNVVCYMQSIDFSGKRIRFLMIFSQTDRTDSRMIYITRTA